MTTVVTDLPGRARRGGASAPARLRPAAPRAAEVTRSKPPVHLVLTITVAVLNVVGLMMVLSASTVVAIEDYGSPWYVFSRQAVWAVIGVLAFVAAVRLPLARWRQWGFALLLLSIALLVVVLFMPMVDGARRWIVFGPFSIQPSELGKLALVLFSAGIVARRSRPGANWRYVAFPAVAWFLVCAVLVMRQPDLDTTIEMGLAVFAVLAIGGLPWKVIGGFALSAVIAVVGLALAAPYRFQRVSAFLDPTADRHGDGYQSYQSLVALGSGQIDGVGLGAGRAKWGLLPNVHTDFVFANVGEELGLFGSVLVLGLFVSLAACGYVIAMRALRAGEAHRFGALVAAGITTWMTSQTLINLGMVTQLGPVSGTPLPFLSAGGSALVVSMAAVGVLVNIARTLPRDVPAPTASPSRHPRRSRANLSG